MPFASQKTEAITFPANDYNVAFIGGGEEGCFDCMGCCLVSGSKWWTQHSPWVRKHSRKLAGSASKSYFCCVLLIRRQNLGRGTHQAETFDMPSSLSRMLYTRSWEMPTALAIWLTVNRLVIHHHVVNMVDVFLGGGCGRMSGPWVIFKALPEGSSWIQLPTFSQLIKLEHHPLM